MKLGKQCLFFFVAFTIGCGRGTSSYSADSAAVMAAVEEYRRAWIDGDTAAALARISNDIRILISGFPDVAGRKATHELFVGEMEAYRVPVLTLNHQDLIVRGDHAIDIGTYEETQVPKTGSAAPIQGRGRFLSIWRKESGEWRIVRYMLNALPAIPPTPPTPPPARR
jgi:ketosteroid isomerase-like protein